LSISNHISTVFYVQGQQDKTLADAIMDRVVHNAYKIELNAKESMRRRRTTLDQKKQPVTE